MFGRLVCCVTLAWLGLHYFLRYGKVGRQVVSATLTLLLCSAPLRSTSSQKGPPQLSNPPTPLETSYIVHDQLRPSQITQSLHNPSPRLRAPHKDERSAIHANASVVVLSSSQLVSSQSPSCCCTLTAMQILLLPLPTG